MLLRLTPLLLALLYGFLAWHFSAWRTRRELDAHSAPLNDPGLRPVLERMAAALEVKRIRVNLYDIAPVNGLAAPDGRIFLTRGFYDRYRAGEVSAEEIASVIAHELGHVALGHSRRRMIDFSGQNAMRMALSAVLGRLIPGVGMMLANLVASIMAARLSQRDEFEADAYAAALLTKAGIGTEPQKKLLARLGALTGSASGGSAPAWLLSHPHTKKRVAAIETLERKWQVARQEPPSHAP